MYSQDLEKMQKITRLKYEKDEKGIQLEIFIEAYDFQIIIEYFLGQGMSEQRWICSIKRQSEVFDSDTENESISFKNEEEKEDSLEKNISDSCKYERILQWFDERNIKLGNPQSIVQDHFESKRLKISVDFSSSSMGKGSSLVLKLKKLDSIQARRNLFCSI